MDIEPCKGAVDWRSGTEYHVVAEVVATFLAERANATRHTRLHSNTVTWYQTKLHNFMHQVINLCRQSYNRHREVLQ